MDTTTSVESCVYLIKAKGTVLHKIGFTTNLRSRLSSLQTSSGFSLQVEKVWEGTRQDEKAFHVKLKAYRRSGEWFRFPSIVLQELLLLDSANAGKIRLPDYKNPNQQSPMFAMYSELKQVALPVIIKLRGLVRDAALRSYEKMPLQVIREEMERLISCEKGLQAEKWMAACWDALKCAEHWQDVARRCKQQGRALPQDLIDLTFAPYLVKSLDALSQ